MLSDVGSALILAPHADDEVLGCAGLAARLRKRGASVHVHYLAVDGFHHYGLEHETTYAERVVEVEAVAALMDWSWEIAYGDQDLIERLDTLARRDLVDRFEAALDERRPDLLLLPSGADYDQDHVRVFETAFAAARPMPLAIGKWLTPHVLSYEAPKLGWAAAPLPRTAAHCDITGHLETKLAALRAYASQLRADPHIRSPEAVAALAALRGKEIGVAHAEAFEVLRTVM